MLTDTSDFVTPYLTLNNTKLDTAVTQLRLARCVTLVGCSGWAAAATQGLWRINYLMSLVFANTRIFAGELALDNSFSSLDSTEKAAISYHLGMGLTKAFAETHLAVPWLSHVSAYKAHISYLPKPAPPKRVIPGTNNVKGRFPDLVGYDKHNDCHVLEAKGSSKGFNANTMQKAINQVSQVAQVSGTAPKTRVACFYMFSKTDITGRIIDPPNDGEGCDIAWSFEDCIKDYYKIFIHFADLLVEFQILNRTYKVFPLGLFPFVIGIDKSILDAITTSGDKFLDVHGRMIEETSSTVKLEDENFDLGIDGVFVGRLFNEKDDAYPIFSSLDPLFTYSELGRRR